MLMSMTGHGHAKRHDGPFVVAAEIRTVNSRYLKLVPRITDGYTSLEPRIDPIVRQYFHRGTVYVTLDIERMAEESDYRLNTLALSSYRRQLANWLGCDEQHVTWEPLVGLPGVVQEALGGWRDEPRLWPLVEQTLHQACQEVQAMRRAEGQAMAKDLTNNCTAIRALLQAVRRRAPEVVDNYRQRLAERINKYLADYQVEVSAADLVREVGLFAERVDISEEIVRLESHLQRFEHIVSDAADNPGRKLEFVIQEMLREANTMGAKSNDAELSHQVVEIKTHIERLREMVQNVE
ncbi:MAG: hypothetical protein KatS3mg110_2634 [Pirellulaceae bacterium]|nr:MAG: hypothetical protein KatS3mg110_2634 [Pirellulaceae bacterium]